MARIRWGRGLLGPAMLALVAGCVAPQDVASPPTGPTEVEMPGIFQAREPAFWDGRPSLSGIWIASPDAAGPEQVVIANLANGRSVKGALFRRENAGTTGPRLLLSEEAAEALRVREGRPVDVRVVAVREQAGATSAVAPAGPTATGVRQIQIGVFAKKENADRVAEILAKIGVSVRLVESDKIGQRVWTVTAAGDAALLQKIRAAGYADAFFQR